MLRCFVVCILARALLQGSVAIHVSSFQRKQRTVKPRNDDIPTSCFSSSGEPGECGNEYQRCQVHDWDVGPRYHLQDATCGLNDPAGPFYDASHGMYHLFYQAHVSTGCRRVQGHMASRDLVHWTRLPVAIWTDMDYDSASIWTGSTTVANGTPYHLYTGHGMPPRSGSFIAAAIPKNRTDPFYKSWTKPSSNPLLEEAERDPSTAWLTPDNEYRMVAFDKELYGSKDFKHWQRIGKSNLGARQGECPSFFPLPKLSLGTSWNAYPKHLPRPTHVNKWSSFSRDSMQVGVYDSDKWRPLNMSDRYFQEDGSAPIDRAEMIYASKDFYDPVKDRRIMWAWGRGYPRTITHDSKPMDKYFSVLTLAREITWNPALQLLQFSPIEEQKLLRGRNLCAASNEAISASQYYSLGKGRQAEVEVIFELPAEKSTFGVVVMGGSNFAKQGSYITVDYETPLNQYDPFTVNVSVSVHGAVIEFPVVSGKLWLLPSDLTLSLQVFVDETVAEIYWQGGRLVMSAVTPPSDEELMAVTSTTHITMQSARAWAVKSPFVSEEEQLRIPRLDGGNYKNEYS